MINRSLLIALLALLSAASPLAAQVPDSASARDTAAGPYWNPGVRLLSVQADYSYGLDITTSFSADLDFIEYLSRPSFRFGVRGGMELVQSAGMLDGSYDMTAGNLLPRMTVATRWVRFDMYGGYSFISRNSGGFILPGAPPSTHRTYHTLKLGTELRVYLIPPALALLIKYSSAIDKPFAEKERAFRMGGIGAVVGWQW